jgi:catechol 2,3-dioxygenase-like lactoylglutathione lyase family enzyme
MPIARAASGMLTGSASRSRTQRSNAATAGSDWASAFLNIKVAGISAAYAEWSAKGAEFLTEPKDHGREIRAFIRDPDGHLIEVGQTTVWPSLP